MTFWQSFFHKMEDYPFLSVTNCLFSLSPATFHISRRAIYDTALHNYHLHGARWDRKILIKHYEGSLNSEYAEKGNINGKERCKMKHRRQEGRAYSHAKNVCLSALPTQSKYLWMVTLARVSTTHSCMRLVQKQS